MIKEYRKKVTIMAEQFDGSAKMARKYGGKINMVAFKNGIHRKEEDNMWKYDKEKDQVIKCTELTGRVVAGHRQLNAFREALGLEKRDKEFKDDEKQD